MNGGQRQENGASGHASRAVYEIYCLNIKQTENGSSLLKAQRHFVWKWKAGLGRLTKDISNRTLPLGFAGVASDVWLAFPERVSFPEIRRGSSSCVIKFSRHQA